MLNAITTAGPAFYRTVKGTMLLVSRDEKPICKLYVPVVRLAGTTMFICARPTSPGVKPQKETGALIDPICATGLSLAEHCTNGEDGDAVPSGGSTDLRDGAKIKKTLSPIQ